MSMELHERNRAIFHALSYIASLKSDSDFDAENLEVGIQCLTEAFKIDLQDPEQKKAFIQEQAEDLTSSFVAIYNAGLKALGIINHTTHNNSYVVEDPAVTANPELWKKWIAKLEDKKFFHGVEVGSQAHQERLRKALGKFKEKFGSIDAPCKTEEQKNAEAEECKSKGNVALNAGAYDEAVNAYRNALEISPNGPNSHIYHSNMAAALMHLQQYEKVVEHCEAAMALNPSFIKAYSRMGAAQIQMKDYQGAIDSYQRGLEVDGQNTACNEGVKEAERLLQESQEVCRTASTEAPAASGMPDLSSLAGMLGGGAGGGGLAGLMNNPALRQMASSVMQNPQMMEMAQNLMQNPEMLSNMMGQMGASNPNRNAGPNAGGSTSNSSG